METRFIGETSQFPSLEVITNNKRIVFDVGQIINPNILKKTNTIGISHFHSDHVRKLFSLFQDTYFLNKNIDIITPIGGAEKISNRIKSYEWNLIEENKPIFTVIESEENKSYQIEFPTGNINEIERVNNNDIEFLSLEHNNIKSLAYFIKEKNNIKINQEKLSELNIKPGSWIRQLKKSYETNKIEEIVVENRTISPEEIKYLMFEEKGDSVLYATDFAFSSSNLDQLNKYKNQIKKFYCEASFLKTDEDLAIKHGHLTAEQSGIIASELGVEELILFHPSFRYQPVVPQEQFIEEASKNFKGGIKYVL